MIARWEPVWWDNAPLTTWRVEHPAPWESVLEQVPVQPFWAPARYVHVTACVVTVCFVILKRACAPSLKHVVTKFVTRVNALRALQTVHWKTAVMTACVTPVLVRIVKTVKTAHAEARHVTLTPPTPTSGDV